MKIREIDEYQKITRNIRTNNSSRYHYNDLRLFCVTCISTIKSQYANICAKLLVLYNKITLQFPVYSLAFHMRQIPFSP